MKTISNRIQGLSESQTIAMSQKSAELKAQGKDIINLSVGQPDFHTPDHIKQAAIQAIHDNYTSYTPVPGYRELREAIAGKLQQENNLPYTWEQIVVSAGAKHSLANALMSVVDPGDEVIVPAPYWVSYVEQVKLAEGKSVVVPTHLDNNFKLQPEQLRQAITEKTKVLMLCSPSNPTGSIYSRQELRALAEVIAQANPNMYVISDEIYEYINFEGSHESIAQFEDIRNRVILVNGVSKGFAMTGWRIGYMAAPANIAKACSKLQGQVTSGACSIAQRAALSALTSDKSFTRQMKKAFKRRRDLVMEGMDQMKGIKKYTPQGAFYLFPDISDFFGKSNGKRTIESDSDLCFYLLEEAQVALVPGSAFGSPQNIRLSYAASDEELKEALLRMKTYLDKLK
ncbi:MAG: pyridoxal phosphate-dependent aminotransferase [Bacteroidales bacterium]|nr:pyridoxal phosphate-dependent aminotransferase [Bacteroidales bacterium]